MKNLFLSMLDLIYKKRCYCCSKSKYSLLICPECYEKLEMQDSNVNRIIDGVNIYSAGTYTKELQKIIRGLKYHNKKELAYYQAKFMYDYLKKFNILNDKAYEIIPVPLHKNRIKKRKYNHMELVGQELAKMLNAEYNNNLIERIKDTKPQYKLSKKERAINLQNAFTVNKDAISKKPLLIIDDICTTGSTFEEIIKILKQSGINDIVCLSTATPDF